MKSVGALKSSPWLPSRSREGAWIEIYTGYAGMIALCVAPVRERGLKYPLRSSHKATRCRSREGAWIEMVVSALSLPLTLVAPVRERGLKSTADSLAGRL